MKRALIVIIIFVLSVPSLSSAKFVGPYSGRVIDSQTGEPVNEATILFFWTKEVFKLMDVDSDTVDVKLIRTDKSGKYGLSKFFIYIGLLARYESLNILVYAPGYKAFIKRLNYQNPYSKPDKSFKEKDYIIKLDRLPPNFDHYKHSDKIDHALWGVDDDEDFSALIEEFKRRYEWEERRGLFEKYGDKK